MEDSESTHGARPWTKDTACSARVVRAAADLKPALYYGPSGSIAPARSPRAFLGATDLRTVMGYEDGQSPRVDSDWLWNYRDEQLDDAATVGFSNAKTVSCVRLAGQFILAANATVTEEEQEANDARPD